MTTAIVTSAAVVTAGMLLSMMVVMIAFCVRVVGKGSGNAGSNRIVCTPTDTAEQLDSCLHKGHLGATANTSANEDIHTEVRKQSCQRAVTASVGVNDLGLYNDAVLDIIHLELCGVAKVLEDFSVFVGYCNFHFTVSFAFNCFIDFLN